jgi:hypothetical protein
MKPHRDTQEERTGKVPASSRGCTELTEKRRTAPPVDAMNAVRCVEAHDRYRTPPTTSYLQPTENATREPRGQTWPVVAGSWMPMMGHVRHMDQW